MQFEDDLAGGVVLVRPALQSPNYVAGASGWNIAIDGSAEFNNVVIRGGTVVGGTALYYNGTPAAGTLIMSIAATAGADTYGNAYVAGVGVYGTSDAVTVRSTAGDTAVLRADAPSGISFDTAPGLELKMSSGDVTAASLTEFDDTFSRGVYLRSSSPLDIASSAAGIDYGAIQVTGRFHGSDPQISLSAGDPADAPAGGIWLNTNFIDANSDFLSYGTRHDFTPGITGHGTATFSTRKGWYYQIGPLKFVTLYYAVSAAGSGAAIIQPSVPFNVYRDTRQILTVNGETVGVNGGGASTIRGGEAVFFTGGSGGVCDRVRVDDRDGDGANNILGADLVAGAILTMQGWLLEDI